MTDALVVPAAVFGGDEFWRRLNREADRRGHEGHLRTLTGQQDPTDVYQLWCQRCEMSIVELMVQR